MSRFLCLWWPDFSVWAAQQSDPALRGRPLLVYQAGRIIAASQDARQAGAQTGWTVHRAQAQLQPILPDAVFWPLHGPTVNGAWQAVLTVLLDFTPCLESQRSGLILADVRPPRAILPLLREWAGQGAVVRAGVADNRALAELAAYSTTAGTLRTIRSGQGATFLNRVPLSLLSQAGVREDTLQRLHWFGWRTLAELSSLTRRQLVAQFDQGALLFRYAQASYSQSDYAQTGNQTAMQTGEQRPVGVYRQPPTVSVSFSFDLPVREPSEWQSVLALLIEQSLGSLQGQGAQALTVTINTAKGKLHRHRLLPVLTATLRPFYEVAHQLLLELTKENPPFSDLTVQLAGLQPLLILQGQLFGRQRPLASRAVRALEDRFPGALLRVVFLDRDAYLPETAFRYEPVTYERIVNHEKQSAQKQVRKQAQVRQKPARNKQSLHKQNALSQPTPPHSLPQPCKAKGPTQEQSIQVGQCGLQF